MTKKIGEQGYSVNLGGDTGIGHYLQFGARPKTKSKPAKVNPKHDDAVETNSGGLEKATSNLNRIAGKPTIDAETPSTAPTIVTLPQKRPIFDKNLGKNTTLGRFLNRGKSVQNVGQTPGPKMSESPARKRIVQGTVSRILTKFETIEKLKNMPPEAPLSHDRIEVKKLKDISKPSSKPSTRKLTKSVRKRPVKAKFEVLDPRQSLIRDYLSGPEQHKE